MNDETKEFKEKKKEEEKEKKPEPKKGPVYSRKGNGPLYIVKE